MMSSHVRSVLSAFLLILSAGSPARGEVLDFPKNRPALTLDVPKGWKTVFRTESGMDQLTIENKAISAGIGLFTTPFGETFRDVAHLKQFLRLFGDEAVKDKGLAPYNLRADGSIAEIPLTTEIKALQQTYRGKGDDGQPATFQVAVFTADAKQYFILFTYYPSNRSNATSEKMKTVLGSIKLKSERRSLAGPAAAGASPSVKPPSSPTPPSVFETSEVFRAYKADASAADRQYKSKTIIANGTVHTVEADAAGIVFVLLEADAGEHWVNCQFRGTEKSVVTAFQAGQKVTVRGQGDGYQGGEVLLKNCELVP